MTKNSIKISRSIPTSGYAKILTPEGDVLEYSFIWHKDAHLIENQPEIDKRDMTKIKAILRKYGVTEFKANLQLKLKSK